MQTAKKEPAADLLINREWCKGCGICVAFCPREALFLGNDAKVGKDQDKCSGCGVCQTYCPDFALTLSKARF